MSTLLWLPTSHATDCKTMRNDKKLIFLVILLMFYNDSSRFNIPLFLYRLVLLSKRMCKMNDRKVIKNPNGFKIDVVTLINLPMTLCTSKMRVYWPMINWSDSTWVPFDFSHIHPRNLSRTEYTHNQPLQDVQLKSWVHISCEHFHKLSRVNIYLFIILKWDSCCET